MLVAIGERTKKLLVFEEFFGGRTNRKPGSVLLAIYLADPLPDRSSGSIAVRSGPLL